jgi:hypothetical protein
MKTGYLWVLWSALALSVITSVTLLLTITDMSLFRNNPLIYIASAGAATTALGVLMQNHYYLPFIKSLRLQGRLLVASLMLLVLSVPAAIIYFYYDLNGKESLSMLSALFTSLAAVFFFASLYTFTMLSRATVFHFFEEETGLDPGRKGLMVKSPIVVLVLFIILLTVKVLTGFNASGLVVMLPLFAILQIILDIFLTVDFRNTLTRRLSAKPSDIIADDHETPGIEHIRGFRSVLLFPAHYLDLITGKLDYINNRADDSYASEVTRVSGNTFDPALLPSLKAIIQSTRFSEDVRHEATITAASIERYYSDPVRNAEMLRRPGIPEKTAGFRNLLVSHRTPQVSDVLRLLGDKDPEARRIGLAVAGRFDLRELREEALQALFSPETEKEAFYLLVHFGPGSYSDIISSVFKPQNTERVSLMIMRLLNLMPAPEAMPYLYNFITGGPVSVRLAASRYMCRQGFPAEMKIPKRTEETIIETIHNIARIIVLQNEAMRSRYFLLSSALEWERSMNTGLLFCLLSLMTGPVAAAMIRDHAISGTAYGAGIAAEVIDTVVKDPVRKPLRALLGHSSDFGRLNELASVYPIREVLSGSLAAMILSSEQNITGIWTKACALHKIAEEGRGINKDLALSYLFSNTQILQEEAAGVIRAVNPEWFAGAESRLPDQVRQKVASVVSGSLPGVSMTFDKTRFLSLCFNTIPEEKMIMLASGMNYSEAYNSDSHPGLLTWIVPSDQGKSGLYILPVDDITGFVFHHPEYTDIFVNYIDNLRS